MALFKANTVNLQQTRALLRAKIAQHGEGHSDAVVYLHGCGNLYFSKEDSDFRKDFTNKNPDGSEPASSYRLIFRHLEDIPKSQDALENAFFSAKAKEVKAAAQPKQISKIPTLTVTDDDLLPEELAEKKAQEAAAAKGKNKGGRPSNASKTAAATTGSAAGAGDDADISGPEGGKVIKVD